MKNSEEDRKRVRIILLVFALGLYVLEGVLFNPFIIWTAIPIYIGYLTINKAWKIESPRKLRQGYGFLIVSVGFSYFYHFSWFFDWGGTKTGSSTSALIFIWFPIYAVILGYIGYLLGSLGAESDEAN